MRPLIRKNPLRWTLMFAWIGCSYLLLAACTPDYSTPVVHTGLIENPPLSTYTPTALSPATLEPPPVEAVTPGTQPAISLQDSTSEATGVAALGFEPCSPLETQSLAELPEIISDSYHPPPMGKDDRHQGVDFSYYRRKERLSIEGEHVRAVLPGVVAASIGDSFPFGNILIVETRADDLPEELYDTLRIPFGQSIYLLYAHLAAAPSLNPGQTVDACQVIGQVGKSGNAGISHLHLEARYGLPGAQFTEMGYYQANTTQAARDSYVRWRMSGEFQHFDPMTLLLWQEQAPNPR